MQPDSSLPPGSTTLRIRSAPRRPRSAYHHVRDLPAAYALIATLWQIEPDIHQWAIITPTGKVKRLVARPGTPTATDGQGRLF